MSESSEHYQEILQLIFKRDFSAAKQGIAGFVKEFPDKPHYAACLKAHCCFYEGDHAKALAVLDESLSAGADQYCFCRITRAGIAFRAGDYAQAINDYDMILADTTPHIVARFHNSIRFFKCFILAQWGDARFETEVAAVTPGTDVWILGGMRSVGDLKEIYASRVRESQGLKKPEA